LFLLFFAAKYQPSHYPRSVTLRRPLALDERTSESKIMAILVLLQSQKL
jgi:hypothetical protein